MDKKILDKLYDSFCDYYNDDGSNDEDLVLKLEKDLDQLINSVKEECAKIAEKNGDEYYPTGAKGCREYPRKVGLYIAKAIRDKKC